MVHSCWFLLLQIQAHAWHKLCVRMGLINLNAQFSLYFDSTSILFYFIFSMYNICPILFSIIILEQIYNNPSMFFPDNYPHRKESKIIMNRGINISLREPAEGGCYLISILCSLPIRVGREWPSPSKHEECYLNLGTLKSHYYI